MLDQDELRRRMIAARVLRGVDQRELAELLEADGLGKTDAGRLERGEIPMRRIHRDALARALGFPVEWFTEPIEQLVVGLGADADGAPAAEQLLSQYVADRAVLMRAAKAVLGDEAAGTTADRRRQKP